MDAQLEGLKFDANGMIPAIVQDHRTGEVLMMAWMNRESLAKTVETGKTHFYSRSRGKLWLKGETSGHTQKVVRWFADCDADTLLFEVEQVGGACHTGFESCFFQELDQSGAPKPLTEDRVFNPEEAYHSP